MHEFQSKKVGGVVDASPLPKKWEDAVPPRVPAHYTLPNTYLFVLLQQ